jgi:hypothetical protein
VITAKLPRAAANDIYQLKPAKRRAAAVGCLAQKETTSAPMNITNTINGMVGTMSRLGRVALPSFRIAVGNIIGSNIFNILAGLGLTALIAPGGVQVSQAALRFDIPVMIASALACLPIFYIGHRISRWEGGAVFRLLHRLYDLFDSHRNATSPGLAVSHRDALVCDSVDGRDNNDLRLPHGASQQSASDISARRACVVAAPLKYHRQ